MFKICVTLILLCIFTACGGTAERDNSSSLPIDSSPSSEDSSPDLSGTPSAELASVEEALIRWKSFGIEDYRLYVTETCDCADQQTSETIWVIQSDFPAAVLPRNGADYKTGGIVRLFDLIGEAIQDGAAVSVEYDPVYSYPTMIEIDRTGQDSGEAVTYIIIMEDHGQLRKEITRNQQLWHNQNIIDYTMTYRAKCAGDCSWLPDDTFVIEVKDRQLISAEYSSGGKVEGFPLTRLSLTIEQQLTALELHAGFASSDIYVEFSEKGYPNKMLIYPDVLNKDFLIGGEVLSIDYQAP